VDRRARNLLLSASLAVAPAGCGFPTVATAFWGTFSDVHGGARPPEEVAILQGEFGANVSRIVRLPDQAIVYAKERDGVTGRFMLTPGTYEIDYYIQPHEIRWVNYADVVQLKAGHLYRVRAKACYALDFWGACRGRRSYTATVWIEDDTAGQVVAGQKW
jgi:hypothetical protein